jgi:hypothetical protein
MTYTLRRRAANGSDGTRAHDSSAAFASWTNDVGTRPPVTNTMFEALEEGLTLLLVEQRDDGALAGAEYAYVMATCEVVAERSAAQSRADERVRAAYLGGGAMTTS